jgi:hypothetical protein
MSAMSAYVALRRQGERADPGELQLVLQVEQLDLRSAAKIEAAQNAQQGAVRAAQP